MKALKLISDETGSMLAITGICMLFFLAILGFGIDFGHFLFVKRSLQNAADATALAAALETRTCNGTSCTAMQTAAQDALTENGFTATTTLTNCTGTSGSGLTLTVNDPPCALTSDPNAGKTNYAEAVLSEQVPTYFASLLG